MNVLKVNIVGITSDRFVRLTLTLVQSTGRLLPMPPKP